MIYDKIGKLTEALKRRNRRSSVKGPVPIFKCFGIGAMLVKDSNHHALNGGILFCWNVFVGRRVHRDLSLLTSVIP